MLLMLGSTPLYRSDDFIGVGIARVECLLHALAHRSLVDGIQLLAGEESNFGLHGTDEQRNIRRDLRSGGIERIRRKSFAIHNRAEAAARQSLHNAIDRQVL